ncbi:MAG TPA: ATP-binding protein [Verrucomicrobiae bacterium]|jgi:PAS domain S-box-containing protein
MKTAGQNTAMSLGIESDTGRLRRENFRNSNHLQNSPLQIAANRRLAKLLGLVAAILGVSVLAGWKFDLTELKTVLPRMVSMAINTALAMVFCGGSLVILSRGKVAPGWRLLVTAMATVVTAVGCLTLCESLFDWELGLDQFLMRLGAGGASNAISSRMAPSTAFCFVLMGGSLLVASRPMKNRARLPLIEAMGVSVLVAGGFAMTGYLLDGMFDLHFWGHTGMAIHTAAGFILLAGAVLAFARSEGGLRWSLNAPATGGFVVGVFSLLIAAAISYYFINQILQSELRVGHTREILKTINSIKIGVDSSGTNQRTYINSGNDSVLQDGVRIKDTLYRKLGSLGKLTSDEPRQQFRLSQLTPLISQRFEWGDRTIAARRQSGLAAAEEIIEGGEGMMLTAKIRKLIGEMEDEEYLLLDERQDYQSSISSRTILLLPLGVFLSVTLLALGLFFLNAGMAERSQTEAQLKESYKEVSDLKAALDEHSIVAITDPQGRITYVNDKFCAISKFSHEELIGQDHRIINSGWHSREFIRGLWTTISRGKVWKGEIKNKARDGSFYWVNTTIVPFLNPDGKPRQYVAIRTDITDQKRAQTALRESHEQLERKVTERTAELQLAKEIAETAGRAKSEFLASMSHELRTPLNGIIGFSEFLADGMPGPLNSKQQEYLGDILNSGRHLLQLINDVLDLAKVEAGKIDIVPETFTLRRALAEVRSVSEPLAQKKNIQVSLAVDSELNQVTLDQKRFKQVVYNLLSNAVKFTDGGGNVEINCVACGGQQLKLSVRDSGIGIKPENLKRLFKEFEQIESGTARRYEGTGLGLALTRKIVEMQGGSICVASEVGKGTTFTVVLPLVFAVTQADCAKGARSDSLRV